MSVRCPRRGPCAEAGDDERRTITALRRVPLFADLDESELRRVASVFEERRFSKGDTVIQQGSGAAAFYVIDSGEVTVLVDGVERRALKAGDYFGEMALIDAGTRTATVKAADRSASAPASRSGTSARSSRRTG